jgi:hypothetical protein
MVVSAGETMTPVTAASRLRTVHESPSPGMPFGVASRGALRRETAPVVIDQAGKIGPLAFGMVGVPAWNTSVMRGSKWMRPTGGAKRTSMVLPSPQTSYSPLVREGSVFFHQGNARGANAVHPHRREARWDGDREAIHPGAGVFEARFQRVDETLVR